jgi:hypothetical protein
MKDRGKFLVGFNRLAAAFGKDATKILAEVWWTALEDIDDDSFARAVLAAERDCRFMPVPAEMRELAGASKAIDAAMAWEASRDAVRKYGYTHSLDFGPVVNAVIRNLGGWSKFCDLTNEALPFERKRFEELFAMFTPRAQFLEQRPLAAGLDEAKVVRVQIGAAPGRKLLA